MEVTAEVFNTVDIGTDGCFGEVAALQLLNHELYRQPPMSVREHAQASAAPAASFKSALRKRTGTKRAEHELRADLRLHSVDHFRPA